MKRYLLLLAALSFAFAPALLLAQDQPPPPPGDQGGPDQGDDQGVSFQTFYDQLGNSGDGNWIQTDNYGYVFQPNVSDPNWAPYTDGHWVYSDEGWVWVSDEPWGWATYHYGRWADIEGIGWVWVPGNRWAPAWVSWRYGDGYCGWAPLPPGADDGDVDFHFGDDVDVSFDIGPGCYNFIPYGYFGASNYRPYIVNRSRNFSLVHRTNNVTNFNVGARSGNGRAGFGGVFAGGPSLAEINAHSSHRVPTVALNAASNPGRSTLRGNSLSIYAPRVNAATARQGRPATVAQTISHPTFNHGTSAHQPMETHAAATGTTSPAEGGFTGEAVHHDSTTGGSETHADSSFTGEAVHHETTTGSENAEVHPEAANVGQPVHHDTTTGGGSFFHPENTGEQVHHDSTGGGSFFHPETSPASAPPEHHEEEQHSEPSHTETHTEAAHTDSHASSGGGGGGFSHSSGGGGGGGGHSSGGGGGNKPSGGGGKSGDNKNNGH